MSSSLRRISSSTSARRRTTKARRLRAAAPRSTRRFKTVPSPPSGTSYSPIKRSREASGPCSSLRASPLKAGNQFACSLAASVSGIEVALRPSPSSRRTGTLLAIRARPRSTVSIKSLRSAYPLSTVSSRGATTACGLGTVLLMASFGIVFIQIGVKLGDVVRGGRERSAEDRLQGVELDRLVAQQRLGQGVEAVL